MSVYGSHPFVCRLTRRPTPSPSGARSSRTSRYTDGHHCASASGSPGMSAPSPQVPSTRQWVTNWYSLALKLDRFAVRVQERNVFVRGELILHLRTVADDDDDRVVGPEQRLGTVLHLLGRHGGDLGAERLGIVLRSEAHTSE